MTKKLERIQLLLSSTDPELQKLGQKLCHKFRIDYYVECRPNSVKYQTNGGKIEKFQIKWVPTQYSLTDINVEIILLLKLSGVIIKSDETLQRIYKIKLCKKN